MSDAAKQAEALRACLKSIERLLIAMDAANVAPFVPGQALAMSPKPVSGTSEQQEREAFEAWFYSGAAKDSPSAIEAWPAWQARAALAANVPDGYKLAPIKPTPEMLKAADDGDDAYTLRNFGPGVQRVMQGAEDHWAAMLAAAPACTCPSGDGSLRWPCPKHPAPAPEATQTYTTEQLAQAWYAIGADVAGLEWGKFVKALGAAPAPEAEQAVWRCAPDARYCGSCEVCKATPAQAQQSSDRWSSFDDWWLGCGIIGSVEAECKEAFAAGAASKAKPEAQPEAQQPLTDEQIMARKPVSADFVSFRAGVRCVEIERAIGEASNV